MSVESAKPDDSSSIHNKNESSDGDIDAQFRSLLAGLRTSLPGVQVLFAFLLTAPLQSGFEDLDNFENTAFAVAFYTSGLASVLLIAPSVHQRVRAPSTGVRRHSRRHLEVATWVTIVGTVAMGFAIISTIYLVSSVAFGPVTAVVAAALLGGTITWAWAYLPLINFGRNSD